jgi:hypothetical protein
MEEMLDWMTASGFNEAIFDSSSDERKCFGMVVALLFSKPPTRLRVEQGYCHHKIER